MGIRSIWNNPYYKNYKPIPRWAFVVDFKGFTIHNDPAKQHDNISSFAENLGQAIVSITFGKRETSIVKTYYAGVESNCTGRVQNTGELNITFNENDNMTISKCLDEIFNGECSNDDFFKEKGAYIGNTKSGFNKVDRTIVVTVLKPGTNMDSEHIAPDYQVAGTFTFHNCILTGINEEELSYDNHDEIITRTAKISYDYMYDGRDRVK